MMYPLIATPAFARRIRRGAAGLILMLLVSGSGLGAQASDPADWKSLFNGRDLTGWVQLNGEATYGVVDGSIEGTTGRQGPNSFLCTQKRYADFELIFEVKIDRTLNSGVQIRSQQRTEALGNFPVGRVAGPQVELENGPGQSGWIYGEATGRKWISPQPPAGEAHDFMRNGEWNEVRVLAEGARIRTWINGNPVADLTDEPLHREYPEGFIGLQVHRIRGNAGPFKVWWRNLRIRSLPDRVGGTKSKEARP